MGGARTFNPLTPRTPGLERLTDYISERETFRLQESVEINTKNLENVFRASEKASSSLEIMQVILAGSLCFDLVDRLTTLYMSFDHSQSWALVIA